MYDELNGKGNSGVQWSDFRILLSFSISASFVLVKSRFFFFFPSPTSSFAEGGYLWFAIVLSLYISNHHIINPCNSVLIFCSISLVCACTCGNKSQRFILKLYRWICGVGKKQSVP